MEAVLDASQSVVAAYRYDPFGVLLTQTGSLTQPYMFSTKRYDAQSGMIQYEYRNYFPAIARWTTRDPLGEAGGMNLYAFVGNNPVNWVEPWGGLDIDNTEGPCPVYWKDEVTDEVHELPPGEKYEGYHDGLIEPVTGDVYKTAGKRELKWQDNVWIDETGKVQGVDIVISGKKRRSLGRNMKIGKNCSKKLTKSRKE